MLKKKPNKLPHFPVSQDLIPVGPKHVQTTNHGKRDQNGLKPSTSRALVLRNGKYGARGTGELVLAGKITGREKLDLLAEDLVSQKSRTALMAPFNLDKCIRIADSQYNAYLDDIVNLKDPDLFHDRIVAELTARHPGVQQSARNASHVALVVSTRVHNAYMVASGWKIVIDILRDLQKSGINDASVRTQLQTDDNLRARFLVLCDILGVLVDLGQAHFSILAMTTPHYSRYFKEVEDTDPGQPSISFDWAGLKDACKSFLDSIIIELCFPRAPYPKRILCQILHDAVDESPREAKRFPQSMWDAVGDLSVVLELQELLESPLLGRQGEQLKSLPRRMPEQYERWLDAQLYSRQASESHANFKDLIDPLERTRDPSVLDNMWRFINLNYKTTSGLFIDSLWGLDEALHRTPQWSSIYMPGLRTYDSDSDDEPSSLHLLKSTGRKKSGGKKKPKKLLAITEGNEDDVSDGSMPDLQSVSDTSVEDDKDVFYPQNDGDEGDDDDEESDYDDGTEYDSEEEEVYRTMLRDAMDAAMEIPEFFDPKSKVPEFDKLAEERKGNPFLKLLGSLRGRMFSSDPKLSSTIRTQPRKGLFTQKGQTAQIPAKPPTASAQRTKVPDVSGRKVPSTPPTPNKERLPASSTPGGTEGYRATVEDAEDEEDATSVAGKKKKKPKKKKKKTTNELSTVQEDFVPAVSNPQDKVPPSTPVEKPITSTPPRNNRSSTPAETPPTTTPPRTHRSSTMPTETPPITTPPRTHRSSTMPTETPARSSFGGPTTSNISVNASAHMSTASLPIEPTVAQSAHSYLQELGSPKEKVKSRPVHGSLFSDKKGFLQKLNSKDKTPKENENDPTVNKKFTWFSKLGKKTAGYMHQLLHTHGDEKAGSLRWENFVKVMRDMGFKYDPSTAGSSVRFDPPNPKDRSIIIHKPHPDSTLDPGRLRDIGKRLKKYYGWSEEDFLRRTNII